MRKSRRKIITYISFAIIAVYVMLCAALHGTPTSRIWEGYTVFFADKHISEETALSFLSAEGCHDVISLSSQKVPYVSHFCPVLPKAFDDYLSARLGYFSDRSGDYELYYVPAGSEVQAIKAAEKLSKQTSLVAGTDGKRTYPFASPLVVVVVVATLLVLSRNKAAFFCPAVLSLPLCFSQPFHSVVAAAVLFTLAFYLTQRIWARRRALEVARRNPYVLVLLFVALLSFLLSGAKAAILGLLSLAAAFSSLYLLYLAEHFLDKRRSFRVKRIFSASQLPLVHKKNSSVVLLCSSPVLLILLLFAFSSKITGFSSIAARLYFPVPSEKTDEGGELPCLEDFYEWIWNVKAFPYRSLNTGGYFRKPAQGEEVRVTRYDQKDTLLRENSSVLMKFDGSFKNATDKEIENLDYPAIEKFMEKQGDEKRVVWGTGVRAKEEHGPLSLVLILVCLLSPVALSLVYAIKSVFRRPVRFDLKNWGR